SYRLWGVRTMIDVRRLKAVGAVLALAAVFTNVHVWGEPSGQPSAIRKFSPKKLAKDLAEETFSEDLGKSKFANGDVISYRTTDGDVLFAMQLKPKLEATTDRSRDYLIMVDTSASQVKGPLTSAIAITNAVVAGAKPADRVAIWTVNIPKATHSLTRGFQ